MSVPLDLIHQPIPKKIIAVTLLGVLGYWGMQVVDLTGAKDGCFTQADFAPSSGLVASYIDGKVIACGGSRSMQCWAYDNYNDEWIVQGYSLLHGDYGMVDSAAAVLMGDDSWLVTGGRVTYPYRYKSDLALNIMLKTKALGKYMAVAKPSCTRIGQRPILSAIDKK